MREPILVVNDLTRWFGTQLALSEVNLQIESRVVVGLVGPNGAGKTTLLHLIAGLLEPSSGHAIIDGHYARKLPSGIASGVICVGDRNEPDQWCSLADLVALYGDASPRFDRRMAQRLLGELDLSERQRHKPSLWRAMSKGQRRWILCSLALASYPRLLLLDEPADGLDPIARRSLYNHVRDYVNKNDATAIISSHILHDLQRAVDELIVLKAGRIVINDTLDVLRDQVREIEASAVLDALVFPDDVQILARQSEGDLERLWIRVSSDSSRQDLDRRSDISSRTVNLESLYLAMIGNECIDDHGRFESQSVGVGTSL